MPYIQFESVGDFIPEPRCSKFVVGLQMSGNKIGGIRGPVGLWTEGPRVMGTPTHAKILEHMLCVALECLKLAESELE